MRTRLGRGPSAALAVVWLLAAPPCSRAAEEPPEPPAETDPKPADPQPDVAQARRALEEQRRLAGQRPLAPCGSGTDGGACVASVGGRTVYRGLPGSQGDIDERDLPRYLATLRERGSTPGTGELRDAVGARLTRVAGPLRGAVPGVGEGAPVGVAPEGTAPAQAVPLPRSRPVVGAPDLGIVANVQKDLNAIRHSNPQVAALLGREELVVDNGLGPRTRAAITAYQRSLGLPPTGIVDAQTQRLLEIQAQEWRANAGALAAAPTELPKDAVRRNLTSTTYYPYNVSHRAQEGGPFERWGGGPIATLEDYLSGRRNDVTVAGYSSRQNQRVLIDGLQEQARLYCQTHYCVPGRMDAFIPAQYRDTGMAQIDVPIHGRDAFSRGVEDRSLAVYFLK